jgi:hypothetical protein
MLHASIHEDVDVLLVVVVVGGDAEVVVAAGFVFQASEGVAR